MHSKLFKTPLPYLALLAAHLIWGLNTVVVKITLQEIPLMSLLFLRFFFAALLISPFLLTLDAKKRRIKMEDIPHLFAVGLFLITFTVSLSYEGIKHTSAINASSLTLLIPIISLLAAWSFLKEKIYWINLIGIVFGLLGVVLVIGLPAIFFGNLSSGEALFGNSLIILSNLTFVIGSLLSKEMLKKYPPIVTTSFIFLVGALTFAIPAFLENYQNPNWIYSVSLIGILGFMFITIMAAICAFFLLQWALAKIDLSHANLFQYIEPAATATLAVPLLGERISFSFVIGTCLIVLGVYWGTLGKQEHHHAHHKSHRL